MNQNKVFNFSISNTRIPKWSFVFLAIALSFTACKEDCDSNNTEQYPSLTVVNQNSDNWYISSVKLVGYEFNNLNITVGNSQTFLLNNGMSGGLDEINTIIYFKRTTQSSSESKALDFNNGATTVITLKGCISAEGCNGFYLE